MWWTFWQGRRCGTEFSQSLVEFCFCAIRHHARKSFFPPSLSARQNAVSSIGDGKTGRPSRAKIGPCHLQINAAKASAVIGVFSPVHCPPLLAPQLVFVGCAQNVPSAQSPASASKPKPIRFWVIVRVVPPLPLLLTSVSLFTSQYFNYPNSPCNSHSRHVFCNLRMRQQDRQLRNRADREDFRAWFECHLLQGLNGRLLARRAPAVSDAILPRDAAAIKRIELFLIALQVGALQSDSDSLGLSREALGLKPRTEFLKWANSDLKRYLQFPVIFTDPESGRITSKMEHSSGDEWENGAVDAILWLLKEDQLSRIKQCSCCQKWFYSLKDDQRFCNTACRQKDHSQGEAFKEQRKTYMRDYRAKGNEKRAKSRASIQGNRKRGK